MLLVEKPVVVPEPVGDGAVDEDEPEGDEEQVGGEADAVREGAGDERGGYDGEHHLIAGEDERRDFEECGLHRVSSRRADVHVEEERERGRAADNACGALPEYEAEAHQYPEDARRSERDHDL